MFPPTPVEPTYRNKAPLRLAGPIALLAFASLAVAGCASAATYNPDSLDAAQISRVSGVCQSVLRLHPSDAPSTVWGAATDPRLQPGENHYQGCVATLSESLRQVGEAHANASSDADCRRQGYQSDSPGLAECVLRSRNDRSSSAGADDRSYAATPVDDEVGSRPDSIFGPSPRETDRREQLACAKIGLNPAYSAFDNCVKNMKDTFYAIENPEN